MKLIVVCASLDLTQPFSATPAWWQLLKAFYEIGVDVIATPYQGPALESLWWRAAPNPAKWQGDAFKTARDLLRKIAGEKPPVQIDETATPAPIDDSASDKLVRQLVQTFITPLWLRHLDTLLAKNPDTDAVLILTAPLNHLVGVAEELQRKHGKPFFYYDGDVPASLPSMSGFASGFRIYQGADPGEYAAVISNSKGGEAAL
ncbi:MAG: hypothetical protein JNJ61_12015, partial [Anaerolineae bacterium]|nr:hypothetical protein [Anaerolineae bacterium]